MNIKLIDPTSGGPVQSEAVVWGMRKPTVDILVRPETPEIGIVHDDPEEAFYRDLLEIIRYGVSHSVAVENIQMEIKSRRHASVIPMEEIGIYVMQVVLDGPSQPVNSPQELLNYVKTTITHLVQVFVNLINEDEQEIELINAIETVAIGNRMVSHIFQHILYHLYDKDIISQESILSWHGIEPLNYEMKKRTSLRKSIDTIVEWLQNADTDSSD
ncbi:Translation initiation factor eIF-2B subunit epsilon-like [Oopsacas minuta]|uniref:Translation initiation factor eIF-2B subunit epsilon-like n=1 Tax=Oopsacas minuta TaxID=111878 RepID=A0AAV7JI67_9METZ|nr:Translation initiation factor eIF-2B subunit epsilon-like [Oopsacas minuta]